MRLASLRQPAEQVSASRRRPSSDLPQTQQRVIIASTP
jgi:hypothetical protein